MSKNIALFIDGTWNKPAADARGSYDTNVRRLYEATPKLPDQLTCYLPGVGTDAWGSRIRLPRTLRNLAGGAGGLGTGSRIREAYRFLAENYDDGDRVFLFGFSRGAFAARSLAGFIDSVGLLLREKATSELVERAYRLYQGDSNADQPALKRWLRDLTGHERPSPDARNVLWIHFIGVWDTVAALGLPGPFKVLSARHTEHHKTTLPEFIRHARHALALHELRAKFEPLLWERTHPRHPAQTLQQTWFAGAHADVGGGYGDARWSEHALAWMADEAAAQQLRVRPRWDGASAQPTAPLHHEIRRLFLFGTPTARAALARRAQLASETLQSFRVHASVTERLLAGAARSYRFGLPWINEQLERIDELTLELTLELRVGAGSALLRERWANVTVGEAAAARGLVQRFIHTHGASAPEERNEVARALCLLFLLESPASVESVAGAVLALAAGRTAELAPEHAKLDVFSREWLPRLLAIAEAFETAASLLPAPADARMAACAEQIRDRFQASLGAFRTRSIAAGVRDDLDVLRIRKLARQKPLRAADGGET